jgi:hypothetical protein
LTATRLLTFGTIYRAVEFLNCDNIIDGLHTIFRGWDISEGATNAPIAAMVAKVETGWTWTSHGTYRPRDWDRVPPRTEVRVMTDVHEAALYWYLAANPDLLCLHGGAAKIGKGLVCFPAQGRAGKSTLIANLAALGQTVFADDVLGLDQGQAFALGFLPRLRTPLAPNLTAKVRSYISNHKGPEGGGWLYLNPDQTNIASLGEKAPFSAFILLRRTEASKPKLEEARTADILHALIKENIIRTLPMETIFDRLHEMAQAHPKYLLTYSAPEPAARYLIEKFS